MIWGMFIAAVAVVVSGRVLSRKMGSKTIFWTTVICTLIFIGGLSLSHFHLTGSVAYKQALSIYCAMYLLFALLMIVFAVLWRWRRVAVCVAGVLVAVFVYGIAVGRRVIRVEQVTISSDRLPKSFDGFRIVLISDLHLGSMLFKNTMVERVVRVVNSTEPDIIVQCGDMVTYQAAEFTDDVAHTLSRLQSKYGVFSIIGNHDLGIYSSSEMAVCNAEEIQLLAREQLLGWHLMDSRTEYITTGQDSISITGLPYPKELIHHSHHSLKAPIDYSRYYPDTERFNITLSHAPQVWEALLEQDIDTDLTLSGHVHAMQMKLFGWTPASLIYRRSSGLYGENGRSLYINDGIGSIIVPIRIGAHPEVTVITLRCE